LADYLTYYKTGREVESAIINCSPGFSDLTTALTMRHDERKEELTKRSKNYPPLKPVQGSR
jgi:hypothetical protein